MVTSRALLPHTLYRALNPHSLCGPSSTETQVQCWALWPWAQRWPLWPVETAENLLWNLCSDQWIVGLSFMLNGEWRFAGDCGECRPLGEPIASGDLF